MDDNEGLAGAADRVRPVALALIEIGASRLPGRALLPLPEEGPTALERLSGAAREVGWIQRVVVIAEAGPQGDDDAAEAARLGLDCQRVPGQGAAAALRAMGAAPDQIVVRLSMSCPLLPPEVISAAVESLLAGPYDEVSTDLGSGVLPAGLDVEACRAAQLYARAELEDGRGALSRGSMVGAARPRAHELSPGELGPALERSGRYYASFRLLLEEDVDVPLLRAVAALLDRQLEPRGLHTLLRLLDLHPEWRAAIEHVIQLRPPAAAVLR